MPILGRFTESDLQAIREKVREAEAGTSGEIVTYLVARCDPYPEARWRGAVVSALAALTAAWLLHFYGGFWGGSSLLWSLLPVLVGLLLGLVLFEFIPPLKKLLISRSVVLRRTAIRAEAAFLEEEVFATRDRTGILLFIALFERRAIVLGDQGINEVVGEEEWESIVDELTRGLGSSDRPTAVMRAIERCGELLERKDLAPREDDTNELSNAPRVRKS